MCCVFNLCVEVDLFAMELLQESAGIKYVF